ncbi:MAG: hypothetical protein JNL74_08905 [Fibrobacteres bacterium]|nr:hypothetical protein [Fibrobacterota bacterium]
MLRFLIAITYCSLSLASTDFDLMPRGTRALAMGGTGVVSSHDAYAPYYNPAALCNTTRMETAVEYTPMFGVGDDLGNGGASIHFSDGLSLAAAYSRSEVNGIPVYEELIGTAYEDRIVNQILRSTGASSGTIQFSNNLFILSMARWFKLNATTGEFSRLSIPLILSGGASLKFRRQTASVESGGNYPDFVGMSTDIDGGLLASFQIDRNISTGLPTKIFNIGFALKNILATDIKYNSDLDYSDEVDRIRTIAFSYRQNIDYIKGSIEGTMDFIKSGTMKMERFGSEVCFLQKYFLRFGYIEGSPSFGLGLVHKNIGIDWAYRHHELASQPYKISISYQID